MSRLLDRINTPKDIKNFSLYRLSRLAKEIRKLIIEVVSKNGGHLASNLGVVELTIALHYVFDAPRDKIIWDVGHQCYTHKILTGRKDKFHTIRQLDGISGFPNREESEYDVLNTGHASTALSVALGMAVARDLKGEDYHIVAVIGDGSLTGGVALEALNQIGHLKKRIIIILNDNEMSISQNVGAISKYLSYIVSGQYYLRIKDTVRTILKNIPAFGRPIIKIASGVEEAVKKTIFPGLLFEELGIRYKGPVEGHSLGSLIEVFEEAKKYDRPVLIHCITRKGKGYTPALKDPEKFHSASPFDIKTGNPIKKSNLPSYSEIFGRALVELAEENEKIIAITAAMTTGTGLNYFAEKYPDRFFDVGIAEQHAVDFACGLVLEGLKPVVAIYSTFLQRAYDQIYHDVCLMNLPVVFAIDRAGVVPHDGPTHQGINDISYLRPMPNMIIMAPKDENELRQMLYTAIHLSQPVALRYPKTSVYGVSLSRNWEKIPIGKAELIKDGEGLILAFGSMVYPCLNVAKRLEKEGISLAVANARFAKPIDEELILKFAKPGNLIITVEEGILNGGFGSGVREFLDLKEINNIKFKSIGIPGKIYPHGKREEILKILNLDEEGLYNQILDFYKKNYGKRKS
ncbi:1-deoxy-D-xylulose-5-phosphate synthase [Candidatus Aminicenantes bacterium AC-708-M15]|jgi:1-deoxy-D-xylulose-5-phosphate synthase|nr:1-deoxy-D-xylulose-5-phosphate synthase [SCandidatus Aminicenantes bacterium Aminicenantia_JdfR_composite]MCP2597067.1 1-deoxy-D-xylulose-5-phosphate synthase [Candidatus Aminicenantes bacterium AC-335-G13]MCP2598669.1 1-deoxy-D-xylulose-5-phosphate synthase [Candidatus Aminicenantes bacterium AC-335-L06]MCP2599003.1 1-deoxy-D-xylulose-5-phosphate synthase [Candidatus Aminicenantes bacterium AC-335-B20]MCP2604185.1 1-deoxy-D-xylulose-5-phosphate synthase [Candidatus Aminicenantes bacterium A